MTSIDTTYFERCITTLQMGHGLLQKADKDSVVYEMYRAACIKEFEIIAEQAVKLLRKVLKHYSDSNVAVDRLYYKDVFRQALLRGMMNAETCERWLQYRDHRNSTAHDYGVNFAEATLELLPAFIIDAAALAQVLKLQPSD